MSLPFVLSALVSYVGDAIVNDSGHDLPIPDRVLRYHGNLPADCCTANGCLSASWQEGHVTDSFPVANVNRLNDPCAAAPVFTAVVRYLACWPVPEVGPTGVEVSQPTDAMYDRAATTLAIVAEIGTRALAALACPGNAAPPGSQEEQFITEAVDRRWLRFVDVTPILPAGGCAGVQWRLYCTPKAGTP